MTKQKLDILDRIRIAAELYKRNFKVLITLSSLSIIIAKVSSLLLRFNSSTNIMIFGKAQFLIQVLVLIIAYVGIFYSTRLSVASELASREYYIGKTSSISESYSNAKGYAWKVILTVFILMLIIAIPALMFRLGITSDYPLVVRALLIIIGGMTSVILGVRFGLAPVIKVLEPRVVNCFSYSNKLVKGSFLEVMILLGITSLMFPLNYLINSLMSFSSGVLTLNIIVQIIQTTLTILFDPFKVVITVAIFMKLSNINRVRRDII